MIGPTFLADARARATSDPVTRLNAALDDRYRIERELGHRNLGNAS